jgi:hypothetical protein
MGKRQHSSFEIICPCCEARLTVDPDLRKVLHNEPPPKQNKGPDLDRAGQLLKEEAERREALFRKGTEDERSKADLLERKFEEALKRTKDQPVGPSLRDFDLD